MKKSIHAAKIRSVFPVGSVIMLAMLLCFSKTYAQTLPVNQMGLDGDLRNLQLAGQLDPAYSFMARPFYRAATGKSKKNLIESDTIDFVRQIDAGTQFTAKKYLLNRNNLSIAVLPFMFATKFNSHHPYGWNDEGMIAAKGLQTELSGGVFANFGPLSIQLQPQFVYAANSQYDTTSSFGTTTNNKSFQKLLAGQSSIRLNVGAVSVGYSNENLWWGPGQFSSLLMSNNAPGFRHFTFNTTRPIKTAIGSFEFQLVAGRLDEDSASALPYESKFLKQAALTDSWRYINGLTLSYQPSFLPNVFVGFSRSFQMNHVDFKLQPNFLEQYLPVFTALFKNSTDNEDVKARDQGISLFTRFVFPKSQSEFYFEYGWNDHSANTRDFFLDPEHSSAYLVGGKKLIPLAKKRWIEISGELLQMAQSPDYIVRTAGNWYEHSKVLQGLTNQKQILGAGSGMGNNVQTLTVNWLDGIKKLGIIFQRIQYDPTAFFSTNLSNIWLREHAWNEIAFGAQARWDFKKVLASVELQHTWSDNYGWETANKKTNLYGLIKIAYAW